MRSVQELNGDNWNSVSVETKRQLVWAYSTDWVNMPGKDEENATGFLGWLDQLMPAGQVRYFLMYEDEQLASLLRLHYDVHPDPSYPTAPVIEALQTLPEMQKKGYATALIHEVQNAVTGPMLAEVHVDNVASQRTMVRGGFVRGPETTPRVELWSYLPPSSR